MEGLLFRCRLNQILNVANRTVVRLGETVWWPCKRAVNWQPKFQPDLLKTLAPYVEPVVHLAVMDDVTVLKLDLLARILAPELHVRGHFFADDRNMCWVHLPI